MTIIQGDCIEYLRSLPDKSIDLVLTDPPYGIGIGRYKQIGRGALTFETKDWDDRIPDRHYFDEMLRVSKNQIIWGGNHFTALLPPSRCWLVWWKNDGLAVGLFADCELAWTSFDRPAQVFNSRWRGFVKDGGDKKIHPTQKALAVMKWCVGQFSKPGETILDPFMGSGTTLLAAKALGRECVGIEQDNQYVCIARERLRRAA